MPQVIQMDNNKEKEVPISKKSIAIIIGVFGIFAALAVVVVRTAGVRLDSQRWDATASYVARQVKTCPSARVFVVDGGLTLGKALGEGMSAAEALSGKNSVAEGAHTAPVLAELVARDGLSMPICEAVNRLLEGKLTAREVATQLLARPLRPETEGDA